MSFYENTHACLFITPQSIMNMSVHDALLLTQLFYLLLV